MFRDEKDMQNSLKDTGTGLGIAIKDASAPISYNKINKLITALYMVTDIMDKEEPIRNKLRTLGVEILSDTISMSRSNLDKKIHEVLSLLDIAGMVNLISEMNLNILQKEFFELKKSIEESIEVPKSRYSEMDLSRLFSNEFSLPSASISDDKSTTDQNGRTRIGVQKGSTLMKALSDRAGSMSNRRPIGQGKSMSDNGIGQKKNERTGQSNQDFDLLKKDRRIQIIAIIKMTTGGATITDIRTTATGTLATCGEKTLQRELIGMVKDGVLKKTGEKRWSRYFLS